MNRIIHKTEAFVREQLGHDTSGHDPFHVFRVRNTAMTLLKTESGNPLVVELGALLHDISDFKFNGGDDTKGGVMTREFLLREGLDADVTERVAHVVDSVSFKGANVEKKTAQMTIEAQIVQDADRLDAIGAVGIARCFAFGGSRGTPMYDPEISPVLHDTFNAYKNHNGTSFNHFYEKLLLLKDRMNTPAAKQIAKERHQFMEMFLETFLAQWQGKI